MTGSAGAQKPAYLFKTDMSVFINSSISSWECIIEFEVFTEHMEAITFLLWVLVMKSHCQASISMLHIFPIFPQEF